MDNIAMAVNSEDVIVDYINIFKDTYQYYDMLIANFDLMLFVGLC
jgi:hypothetical protein